MEALLRAIRFIHDAPGPSGLSPYQIHFGRDRPMSGIPQIPSRKAEDALQFFKRMKEVDEKVSQRLTDLHVKQASHDSLTWEKLPDFKAGDKVCF